jgi:hypothetical protein
MKHEIGCMTENDLRKEAKRLDELVRKGEATIVQANRLADLNRAIARIRAVHAGKAW